MTNLDFLCMQSAQAMAAVPGKKGDKENFATKSLGVLLENGPYGMILYLETQKDEVAKRYCEHLVGLLRNDTLHACFPTVPSERKLISPRQEGHKRVYPPEQVIASMVVAELRRNGLLCRRCGGSCAFCGARCRRDYNSI